MIDKFVKAPEQYRRMVGFCLLFPSLYLSYLMYINFESIQYWLFSLSGVDPENIRPTYKDSWIGLLLLTMLSVVIGVLLNNKNNR